MPLSAKVHSSFRLHKTREDLFVLSLHARSTMSSQAIYRTVHPSLLKDLLTGMVLGDVVGRRLARVHDDLLQLKGSSFVTALRSAQDRHRWHDLVKERVTAGPL